MSLRGKIVYISGGSSGIGLATARLLLERGASVFLFARDPRKLAEAQAELSEAAVQGGGSVATESIDVADHLACEAALTEAVKRVGPPFAVVNSAGVGGAREFARESFERFDQRVKINLYGVRNVIAPLLPAMIENGGGHIVNVSSLAGLLGVYGFTSYSASKFGVVGFSEALRCELKKHGIWVSVFCPPDVDTPMLSAENDDKPLETKALSAGGGLMSAPDAARHLIDGMLSKRFMLLPGTQSRLLHLVNRWTPGLRERIIDRIIARARDRG